MLLRQLQYPEDATANMFRKEIRTLEDGLKKLETSEAKYAAKHLQDAYVTKYDRTRMYDSKRNIANLLGEEAEERSLTARLRAKQREQQQQTQRKPKNKDWER